METTSVQQEILLITGTSFSERQILEKDALENQENFNSTEKLEAACWNGLLNEMLPEIINKSVGGKGLYVWGVMQAKSFIDIELCEYPQAIDTDLSINPYTFLTILRYA